MEYGHEPGPRPKQKSGARWREFISRHRRARDEHRREERSDDREAQEAGEA